MEEWVKEYFEVEALVEDQAELEVAKANLTGLIDGWLSAPKPVASARVTQAPSEAKEQGVDYSKLFWEKKQGEKGEYEQTSEKTNHNCDAWKQLKAKVKEHKGFWQDGGYKFWFHQQDETVIDRRQNRSCSMHG